MQRRKIRNLNSTAFLVFLLIPFFRPASFELIAPLIETFFDAWRVVSFSIIVVMYLYVGRLSKIIAGITCYQAALFLSTLINDGNYWTLGVSCGTIIGFCMLTELCIQQNCYKYFAVIFRIYFVLIIANFVVLLLFPDGIATDTYYSANVYGFLGFDNMISMNFSLPLMGIACIYSALRKQGTTVSAVLLVAIISATVLFTWSATGVVAWAILLAYILFIYKKPYMKFFNSYMLFGAFVGMQVVIVLLRLQDHFSYIIENILGKTLTFTGRTHMWDLSYIIIAQSPIIGHGVYEGHGLVYLNNKYWYAHNAVLEVMTQGGAIGLILFIIPFLIAARKLFEQRQHFLAGITVATIFSFLMVFLMEAPITSIWLFGFLVIGTNISSIIEQYKVRASKHSSVAVPHYRFIFTRQGER